MNKLAKSFLFVLLIFFGLSLIFSIVNNVTVVPKEISLSEAIQILKNQTPQKVIVSSNNFEIYLDEENIFKAEKEPNASFLETLQNFGFTAEEIADFNIEIKSESSTTFLFSLLVILLPLILFGVFLFYSLRRANQGAMQVFSFAKSNIRLFAPTKDRITFKDVAGLDEAKEELKEVVEFLKNPKKFQDLGAKIPRGVLLMGPPGSGKCVIGNTLISTNKGLIPINEIPKYFTVRENNEVAGLDVISFDLDSLEFKFTKASHWYQLGKQKTISIETDLGTKIEGTSEHPVVVIEKISGKPIFKKLNDIKEDDWLVMGYNNNFFGSYTKIPNKEISYLLGVLIGDGGLTIKNRICFSTSSSEIKARVQRILQDNFHKKLTKIKSREYDYQLVDSKIKQELKEYGLEETYAEGKRMPEWVRLAPKEFVIEFLRGVFDTDGYVEKKGAVGISSASRGLIEDIHLSLMNLGIVNRIYERKKNYNHKLQFYLTIYGDFVERFQEEIGFNVKEKRETLKTICQRQRNTNINLIPHQGAIIGSLWLKAKANSIHALNREFYRQSFYKNLNRYINEERMPSLSGLSASVEEILKLSPSISSKMPEVNHLEKLSSGRFFFTKIKKISSGQEVVYDLTVPVFHNFLANGIINHNTLLARAVAGEAKVPFFHISGSEFVEMFVGVGASRVRDTFGTAKKSAPSILFIDEIDAIGRVRGAGLGGGHDEREQTLNQILVEMDGFDRDTKTIVIAATNRPDVLDPALLRPGRFDRRVVLDLPSIDDREKILKIHTQGKVLAPTTNLREIAERTPGFSGADLANLVNEAAILAARRNKKSIDQEELLDSIEKVILGPERKSRVLTKKEKEITAYHEAGHALATALLPGTALVRKISIITRGRAAGYTMRMPTEEKYMKTRSEFLDDLCALLGGYAAEEIKFKDVSTGAANDLEEATNIARSLVTKYGMSKEIGPVSFGKTEELIFLGREITAEKDYSEETAAKIDKEVFEIIRKCYQRTKKLLKNNLDKLEKIAQELIKKEVLEKEEFEKLVNSHTKQG
jgi:cell division protease FtsH